MPFRSDYAIAAGLLLLFILALWLLTPTPYGVVTVYVSQEEGLDSRTCEQARSAATPRRSINQGLACVEPGGTVQIGPGTYDELLVSQASSSRTCHSGDVAVQPGCAPIPNGVSPTERTTLLGSGTDTVLSPVGRQLPGGGSAITLLDYARHLHIEGLRIVKHTAAGSVGGIYMGNVQYVTVRGNELDNGQVKAGMMSRFLTVTHNHIWGTGKDTCPQGVKPTPAQCPHGMYICGTDHVITDNRVSNSSYYAIQVSCEQGGIARIKIERNLVENAPVVGIRCGGTDCLVAANILKGNGTGISVSGSGVVSGNTIHSYYRAAWDQDPWGIWISYGDGSGFTITNNLLTEQKNSYVLINNAAFAPVSPTNVHHNMSNLAGNAGVTLIAPSAAIYTNAAGGDFTLKASSPAIKAGVVQPQVTKDITGTAYPNPPDLGAYSSQWTAPPATDTTAPTVRLTNPPAGERVFGEALPLSATASDNVGVVSVRFAVDGAQVGEVKTPPYSVLWDTRTVGNGSHAVSAVAVDAAGNVGTAQSTLVVDNPPAPMPPDGVVLRCAGKVEPGGVFAMACSKP